MKIVVLDSDTLGKDLDLSPLSALGETDVYGYTSPEDVATRVRGADVVVANKAKLRRDNLCDAKNIAIIAECATGYDNIDLPYCRETGIAVVNVPGYSTDSVAQVTVATVLSLATHLPAYHRHIADGEYSRGTNFNLLEPVYHEISGKKWGIIGLGNIGCRVARIAEAFGCHVMAYTRTEKEGYDCVSLETLCSECDIITIHVPLNPATDKLIDETMLCLMKPGTILVNEARGAVVDEAAAARAAKRGHILYGCDVYSQEPFREDHPYYELLGLENVCLTPHMAWGAKEARERCLFEVVENIKAFYCGEKRNRVD